LYIHVESNFYCVAHSLTSNLEQICSSVCFNCPFFIIIKMSITTINRKVGLFGSKNVPKMFQNSSNYKAVIPFNIILNQWRNKLFIKKVFLHGPRCLPLHQKDRHLRAHDSQIWFLYELFPMIFLWMLNQSRLAKLRKPRLFLRQRDHGQVFTLGEDISVFYTLDFLSSTSPLQKEGIYITY